MWLVQNPEEAFADLDGLLLSTHNSEPVTDSSLARWRSSVAELRAGQGLPVSPNTVVLASFNRHLKLDQTSWRVWMQVLAAVPSSVLWLYCPDAASQGHLRRAAAAHGVAPGRLYFMAKVPKVGEGGTGGTGVECRTFHWS